MQKRVDGTRLDLDTTGVECVYADDPESIALVRVLKEELNGYEKLRTRKCKSDENETIIKIKVSPIRSKNFIRVKNGSVTGLWLYRTKRLPSHFLESNPTIRELHLKEVTEIEDECFSWVKHLDIFDAPKLREVGRRFFMMLPDSDKSKLPSDIVMRDSQEQSNLDTVTTGTEEQIKSDNTPTTFDFDKQVKSEPIDTMLQLGNKQSDAQIIMANIQNFAKRAKDFWRQELKGIFR